jgi:hypothetical protein
MDRIGCKPSTHPVKYRTGICCIQNTMVCHNYALLHAHPGTCSRVSAPLSNFVHRSKNRTRPVLAHNVRATLVSAASCSVGRSEDSTPLITTQSTEPAGTCRDKSSRAALATQACRRPPVRGSTLSHEYSRMSSTTHAQSLQATSCSRPCCHTYPAGAGIAVGLQSICHKQANPLRLDWRGAPPARCCSRPAAHSTPVSYQHIVARA